MSRPATALKEEPGGKPANKPFPLKRRVPLLTNGKEYAAYRQSVLRRAKELVDEAKNKKGEEVPDVERVAKGLERFDRYMDRLLVDELNKGTVPLDRGQWM